METEIRLASVREAGLLSRISFKSWQYENKDYLSLDFINRISPDRWTAAFRNGMSTGRIRCLILSEHELSGEYEDVGCVSFGESQSSNGVNAAELYSLYVLPDRFDRGYGTQLLHVALSDIYSNGFSECCLWVSEENERARIFYEREGFIYTGDVSVSRLNGNMVNQLKMSLRIRT